MSSLQPFFNLLAHTRLCRQFLSLVFPIYIGQANNIEHKLTPGLFPPVCCARGQAKLSFAQPLAVPDWGVDCEDSPTERQG